MTKEEMLQEIDRLLVVLRFWVEVEEQHETKGDDLYGKDIRR